MILIYLFEIGGKNKDFSQTKNLPNSYLAIDDIELGNEKKNTIMVVSFFVLTTKHNFYSYLRGTNNAHVIQSNYFIVPTFVCLF